MFFSRSYNKKRKFGEIGIFNVVLVSCLGIKYWGVLVELLYFIGVIGVYFWVFIFFYIIIYV